MESQISTAQAGCSTYFTLAVDAGLSLAVPAGVTLTLGRAISGTAAPAAEQQERVRAALARPEGLPPLAELARGQRRVCVAVGDLSLPAPYEAVLPVLVKALVEAGIRPSRIQFLAAPGNGYPVLGRGAIHRYGEEIVGEHELSAWDGAVDGVDPRFAAADLRIVVAPDLPGREFLPLEQAHVDVVLKHGAAAKLAVAGAMARPPQPPQPPQPVEARAPSFSTLPASDALLLSGGGGEWEATLEEALLSLHAALAAPASPIDETRTLALAFSGREGLGSAHFTRDFFALLEQARQALSEGGGLQMEREERFDAAAALAEALSRSARVLLFSRGLAEHDEGGELAARLSEWPALAGRLYVCGHETDFWELLRAAHGPAFRLHAEPLGWRGLASVSPE